MWRGGAFTLISGPNRIDTKGLTQVHQGVWFQLNFIGFNIYKWIKITIQIPIHDTFRQPNGSENTTVLLSTACCCLVICSCGGKEYRINLLTQRVRLPVMLAHLQQTPMVLIRCCHLWELWDRKDFFFILPPFFHNFFRKDLIFVNYSFHKNNELNFNYM